MLNNQDKESFAVNRAAIVMDANVLHFLSPKTLINLTKPSSSLSSSPHHTNILSPYYHHFSLRIRATNSDNAANNSDNAANNTTSSTTDSLPSITSTDNAETGVRFRRGSRKRAKTEQDQNGRAINGSSGRKKEVKKWEEMSYAEKAMDLYVGEKGALFWLNKFAYASIYIMIGAWILFRFVGPAFNFYQLDAPPLSPTDVLKG